MYILLHDVEEIQRYGTASFEWIKKGEETWFLDITESAKRDGKKEQSFEYSIQTRWS